jgi:hypothetical protein
MKTDAGTIIPDLPRDDVLASHTHESELASKLRAELGEIPSEKRTQWLTQKIAENLSSSPETACILASFLCSEHPRDDIWVVPAVKALKAWYSSPASENGGIYASDIKASLGTSEEGCRQLVELLFSNDKSDQRVVEETATLIASFGNPKAFASLLAGMCQRDVPLTVGSKIVGIHWRPDAFTLLSPKDQVTALAWKAESDTMTGDVETNRRILKSFIESTDRAVSAAASDAAIRAAKLASQPSQQDSHR